MKLEDSQPTDSFMQGSKKQSVQHVTFGEHRRRSLEFIHEQSNTMTTTMFPPRPLAISKFDSAGSGVGHKTPAMSKYSTAFPTADRIDLKSLTPQFEQDERTIEKSISGVDWQPPKPESRKEAKRAHLKDFIAPFASARSRQRKLFRNHQYSTDVQLKHAKGARSGERKPQ
jgi:hypothetical protein